MTPSPTRPLSVAVVPRPPSSRLLLASCGLAVALLVSSWWFVLREPGASLGDLLSADTRHEAARFLSRFAGTGEDPPAYLDPIRWREAAALAGQTLAMSVLAIAFAGLGTLATVMVAARPVADGERGPIATAVSIVVRLGYVLARAVPELVWALLIVFVFSPGVLAGALALGLHNLGVLGRLCAEAVEDLDPRPVRAVRSTGAGRSQTLFYAILPAVLPTFITYLVYRWEVVIRTTIVVGFVSAAGLGREFRLRMSFFHYSDIALLLLVYLLLVFAAEICGAVLRRLAR